MSWASQETADRRPSGEGAWGPESRVCLGGLKTASSGGGPVWLAVASTARSCGSPVLSDEWRHSSPFALNRPRRCVGPIHLAERLGAGCPPASVEDASQPREGQTPGQPGGPPGDRGSGSVGHQPRMPTPFSMSISTCSSVDNYVDTTNCGHGWDGICGQMWPECG